MSNKDKTSRLSETLEIQLLGSYIPSPLSVPIHNYICQSLKLPWKSIGTECPTIEDCVRVLHSPNLAGAVVTMPWKSAIIKHLDYMDDTARLLNACNAVYFGQNGQLCGTNVDWIGIEGALRAALAEGVASSEKILYPHNAIVIGAGGAARAAIYALVARFGIEEIYVLNRDDKEVQQLRRDCSSMNASIEHIRSLEEANELPGVAYVVGTVPDFEPKTAEEKRDKTLLASFLDRGPKGVVLDMCYHPSMTRHLKLAQQYGWQAVSGTQVVGHQAKALWRLWVDQATVERADWEGMWKCLREEAKRFD